MKQVKLLRAAGIICILFSFFHLAFPLIPGWEASLNAMIPDIRYIFRTFHFCMMVYLAFTGFICTFQTKKMLKSPVKASVLLMFASLFAIRFVAEFLLWGFSIPQSIPILIFCFIPASIFISIASTKRSLAIN